MSSIERIVIVGAGLAGACAAEALRSVRSTMLISGLAIRSSTSRPTAAAYFGNGSNSDMCSMVAAYFGSAQRR
jgi:predicted NAD/FAD-dependent oxidoreductase